jgi:hypothetical protein
MPALGGETRNLSNHCYPLTVQPGNTLVGASPTQPNQQHCNNSVNTGIKKTSFSCFHLMNVVGSHSDGKKPQALVRGPHAMHKPQIINNA